MFNLIEVLSEHFQQYFQIIVNDQVYRCGKLINISYKEIYIKLLYIDQKHNKQRNYEILNPFNYNFDKDKIILDYTLNTFCNNNEDLMLNLKKINTNFNHHIFYNKKITINFSNSAFTN